MKYLPLILWLALSIGATLLLAVAIFIHRSIATFTIALSMATVAHTWYKEEIKHLF